VSLSRLEEGGENGFLNRWSAVHKTCKNSGSQTLEILACPNKPCVVLKSDG